MLINLNNVPASNMPDSARTDWSFRSPASSPRGWWPMTACTPSAEEPHPGSSPEPSQIRSRLRMDFLIRWWLNPSSQLATAITKSLAVNAKNMWNIRFCFWKLQWIQDMQSQQPQFATSTSFFGHSLRGQKASHQITNDTAPLSARPSSGRRRANSDTWTLLLAVPSQKHIVHSWCVEK